MSIHQQHKNILILGQYPEKISPAQRFRLELYYDLLTTNGYHFTSRSFLDEKAYAIIYKPGFIVTKSLAVLKGFWKRLLLLPQLKKYDYILLQREVTPLGPPVFEWLFAKVFKKKVVYDFDDAIWITHISKQNQLALMFKNTGKVKSICKWAYKVSAGNDFLKNFAAQYNSSVVYNPTCLDTDRRFNLKADHDTDRITIGWTGSFSTLKYFYLLEPVLKRLQEKYDFDIKVICNQPPEIDLKNVIYVEWTEDNEVTALAGCQIGLMPLIIDAWSEGKCGFKLIQYLSLEIAAVSTPIGVNTTIIENNVTGLLCQSNDDWYAGIETLLLDKDLRKRLGKAGREKIVAEYSLKSNANNFLQLFS